MTLHSPSQEVDKRGVCVYVSLCVLTYMAHNRRKSRREGEEEEEGEEEAEVEREKFPSLSLWQEKTQGHISLPSET